MYVKLQLYCKNTNNIYITIHRLSKSDICDLSTLYNFVSTFQPYVLIYSTLCFITNVGNAIETNKYAVQYMYTIINTVESKTIFKTYHFIIILFD